MAQLDDCIRRGGFDASPLPPFHRERSSNVYTSEGLDRERNGSFEDRLRMQAQLRRVECQRNQAERLNQRYRDEIDHLEDEVLNLRDQLLAVQLAYNELAKHRSVDAPPEDVGLQAAHTSLESPVLEAPELANSPLSYPSDHFQDDDLLDDEYEIYQQLEIINRSDQHSDNPHTDTDNWSDYLLNSPSSSIWSLHSPPSSPPSSEGSCLPVEENQLHDHNPLHCHATVLGIPLVVQSPDIHTNNPIAPDGVSEDSFSEAEIDTSSQAAPVEIFVDASGTGIGFVFQGRWLAWEIQSNPKVPRHGRTGQVDMSWAEIVAVEMGLRTLIASGVRATSVIIRSDNEGVVKALTRWTWGTKSLLNTILSRVKDLSTQHHIQLRARWISTKFNPADKPSRGNGLNPSSRFMVTPELPSELKGLIRLRK